MAIPRNLLTCEMEITAAALPVSQDCCEDEIRLFSKAPCVDLSTHVQPRHCAKHKELYTAEAPQIYSLITAVVRK